MSVSPYVKFNFENNNVVETTPLMGVSCILTRTTKGPYNDPSKVISSYAQFQREFGEEEMEDGSVSNVQKALELGSKLRIIRVLYGQLDPGTIDEEDTVDLLTVGDLKLTVKPKITANKDEVYSLTISKDSGNSYTGYNYTIYDKDKNLVESGVLIRYKAADGQNNAVVDYNSVQSFISNSTIIEPASDNDFQNLILTLQKLDNTSTADLGITVNPKTYAIVPNSEMDNATPDPSNFETALNALLDYTDVYQVAFSQLHLRFRQADSGKDKVPTGSNYLTVYQKAAEILKPLQEYTLYIEVPKTCTTVNEITSWISTVMGSVGNSKYIAYFAGGIKYYNSLGSLVNCDCIGTVMGLGDASATNYGPWKSFAGMNRGVIWDGHGPVCPNYGSPSKYDDLNTLAEGFANMIVVKDTASSGKQTMIWHLFTSQIKQDSERFLSIVRLNLYLKKTLRPILENYLEEPNTWGTWKSIYLRVKPILDNLVDQQAMTQYTWMGDQNATSYDTLTVNNEADVRQGKYKVVLKYKDIVPMQEITINITIDAASQSVSIDTDSSNA